MQTLREILAECLRQGHQASDGMHAAVMSGAVWGTALALHRMGAGPDPGGLTLPALARAHGLAPDGTPYAPPPMPGRAVAAYLSDLDQIVGMDPAGRPVYGP